MARIRTIKPEFWTDDKIGSISRDCRLFFIALWSFSDDQGVINGNPVFLKSCVFPYDDDLSVNNIIEWLDTLCTKKMLISITHEEEKYYLITRFARHQKFDPRYKKYILPNEIVNPFIPAEVKNEENKKNENRAKGKRERGTNRGIGIRDGDRDRDKDKNYKTKANALAKREGTSSKKNKEENSEEPCTEATSEKTWRDDFEIYLSELNQSLDKLLADAPWIREQELYHPNVDIRLSIQKAVNQYWGTLAGWKKRKASRTKVIDWRATLAYAIGINRVFKSKQNEEPESHYTKL